jgi:HEAT repeat protein
VSHPLLERFASSDPGERARACRSAARDPSAVVLLDPLEKALGDPVVAVARAASDALAEIGSRASEVGALLRRAVRSDRPNARWGAAFAAAHLAPPDSGLLPPLVEALACEAGDVRWRAARLLAETGSVLPELQPLLAGLATGDARPRVRRMAAHCLRELAPDEPETTRVLLEATRDRDLRVRRASLSGLAALVDPPPEVAERLLEASTADADAASRCIAVGALGAIAARQRGVLPDAAEPALRRIAEESDDGNLRSAAARALRQLAGGPADSRPPERSR